jgi:molybdenum cofactor cytidylyltransferase
MSSSPGESDTVAAVLLAAGSSTRMGGENKLLLALDGEPVVARAARAAIEARLEPVIVVVGHEADRVRGALRALPCQMVVNPDHALGKGSSLQAGISEASFGSSARAAVVMLADMPFVTSAMLRSMVERYRASGAPMVVSRYGDVNAPPMLYDRALFAELLALPGEACGKEMVRRHRAEAAVMDWPESALADIDVPGDYQRAREAVEKP